MARIRSIKPQFFLNEELSELPAIVRLLFIGLWTQADREGRLLDRPKRLKAELFPYDNFDVDKGLNQLSDAGFIFRYKVNANITDRILAPEQPITELALIQIKKFLKHQKIDKANESESDLPPPLELDYNKTSTSLPKDGEGKGKEGNRKGREREAREHPFCESEIFDKEVFRQKLKGTQYESASVDYYHEVIKNWSASKNSKKIDWLAAAKNWIAQDTTAGKLITNDFKPPTNGAKTNYGKPARKTNEQATRELLAGGGEVPDFLKG